MEPRAGGEKRHFPAALDPLAGVLETHVKLAEAEPVRRKLAAMFADGDARDDHRRALSLYHLALGAVARGDPDRGEDLAREAKRLGDARDPSRSIEGQRLVRLARLLLPSRELRRAVFRLENAPAFCRAAPPRRGEDEELAEIEAMLASLAAS